MRSRVPCAAVLGGVILASFAAFAGLGSGGHPADGMVTNSVAYARRGALGADDYVVTNLWMTSPAFALRANCGTQLVDRAMNRCLVTNDTVFVFPRVPPRKSYDPPRLARSFVLVTEIRSETPPEISFSGMRKFYTLGDPLRIGRGVTFLSFYEIGEEEFLVDMHELTEQN